MNTPIKFTFFEYLTACAILRFDARIPNGARRWPSPSFTKRGPGRRHNGLQKAAGSKLWPVKDTE